MINRVIRRFKFEWRRTSRQNWYYRNYILVPSIIKDQKKVADYWNEVINDYDKGYIKKYVFKKKKDFTTTKIIWQFWAQGDDKQKLPEIVNICFKSIDFYASEYEIVRLNIDNVIDYIDLPDFVFEKLGNSNYGFTFFSDILRVALLNTYGGIWMDATLLLTDEISKFSYIDDAFFAFERSEIPLNMESKEIFEDINPDYWSWNTNFKVKLLNSFMVSKSNNKILGSIQDLLLHYWSKHGSIQHYFIFQILYNELIHKYDCKSANIISDELPHLLFLKIKRKKMNMNYKEIFDSSIIHKMTYLNENEILVLKEIIDNNR